MADWAELPSTAKSVTALANELRCAICLSVMKQPVARLCCCHSFCRSCLQQALRQAPCCPLCKAKAGRRDIMPDARLDAAVAIFAQLDTACEFLTQLPVALCQQPSCSPRCGGELEAAPEALAASPAAGGEMSPILGPEHLLPGILRPPEGASQQVQAAAEPRDQEQQQQAAEPQAAAASQCPASQAGSLQGERAESAPGSACIPDSGSPSQAQPPMQPQAAPRSPTAAAGMEEQLQRTAAGPLPVPDRLEQPAAAPTPPVASAKAAASVRVSARLQPWACSICTLSNAGTASSCAACGAARLAAGSGGQAPIAAAPLPTAAPDKPRGRLRMPKGMGAATGAKRVRQPSPCEEPAKRRAFGAGPAQPLQPTADAPGPSAATDRTGPSQAPEAVPAPAQPGSWPLAEGSQAAAAQPLQPPAHPPLQEVGQLRPADKRRSAGKRRSLPARAAEAVVGAGKRGRPRSLSADGRVARRPAPIAAPQQQQQQQQRRLQQSETGPVQSDAPDAVTAPQQTQGWGAAGRKWVLLASGVAPREKARLRALAAAAGAKLAGSFDASVTHVVCGTDAGGKAKRTLKFLLGVLHGKWVVHASWAEACLAAGHPVPEEPHEVRVDSAGQQGGPLLGRLQAGLKLLRGWEVYLCGDFCLPRASVEAVLKAAGARLLRRPPPAAETLAALKDGAERRLQAEGHTLVLVEGRRESPALRPAPGWAGVCVDVAWLMDTASNYTVQPLQPYLVELH